MAHSIELVKDKKYVILFLIGDQTKDNLEIAREEASNVLAENGLNRVLVDVTQGVNRMPISDDFDFTKDHQKFYPENTRHALLVSPEGMEKLSFTETVSRNRGISLKLFLDRDEAINWLIN